MIKRSFDIGALTDIGNVKRTNQDNVLVKVGDGSSGEFGLFIVADGMGGLAAGEVASRIIVDEFSQWWDQRLSIILYEDENADFNLISSELNTLITDINKKIIDFGISINEKVGSTLSMLFIYGDKYLIKHIGDSRVYMINNSMIKLTEDHSWVAQQVREGKMTREEAKNHPKRNILTRCIGVMDNIEIFESIGDISPGDDFLLCSDGFYNFLDEDEVYNFVVSYKNEDEDIQKGIVSLLERVKQRGAHDNISVIVVCQHLYSQSKSNSLNLKEIIRKIADNFGRR